MPSSSIVPSQDPQARTLDQKVSSLSSELERIEAQRQNFGQTFGALLTAAFVLATGYYADAKSSVPLPDWAWAGVATVPFLLFGYVVNFFAKSVVLSYYARTVERFRHSLVESESGHPGIALVYDGVVAAFEGNRRGLLPVRTIHYIEYVCLPVLILAPAVGAWTHINNVGLRVLTGLVIALMTISTCTLCVQVIFRGAQMWSSLIDVVNQDLAESFPRLADVRDSRRLVSYLWVPRPNELIVKGLGLHLVSALVGAWIAAGNASWTEAVKCAAVSFVAFEFLMYQARYMLNDWRGQDEDALHPSSQLRQRMPRLDSAPRTVAFWCAFSLRIAGAVALPYLLAPRQAWVLFGALVLVWLLAFLYERLRVEARNVNVSYTPRVLAVFVIVGVSYLVRVMLGLYLGSDGTIPWAVEVLVGVTFYFSGLSTVLMTWTLESTKYVGRKRGVDWSGTHSGEGNAVSQTLGSKAHLLPLAHSAGILQRAASFQLPTEITYTNSNSAVLRDDGHPAHAWNSLTIAGVASGGLAACSIINLFVGIDSAVFVAAGAVGLCLGALTVWKPIAGVVVCAIGAVVIASLSIAVGHASAGTAVLTFVAPVLTYISTRGMNYDQVVGLTHAIGTLPAKAMAGVRLFLSEVWR